MKPLIPIIMVMWCIFSCSPKEGTNLAQIGKPMIIVGKGYVIPKDNLEEPKVITAGQPAKVDIINPKVVYPQSNVHPAGNPKIVPSGNPKVVVPGRNGLPLPQINPALFSTVIPAIPDLSPAKEASSKDQNPHNFSTFSKLQGLKSNLILSLLEDNQGNIWFGTNYGGVSKYDGKNFSHYSTDEGLSNYSVRAMIEDDNGTIWFGTHGGGLTKYDGKTFSHLTKNGGLGNNRVFSMLKDKSGNLWLGTIGGGVGKFDGKTITNYSEKEGLNDTIISILEDRSGYLWFGSYNKGVIKYDGKTFTHYTEKEGIINNTIMDILEDKNGHIWLATPKGVCKYDGKDFTYFTEKEGLSNNDVRVMWEDKSGLFWFGTGGGGVNSFDGKYFNHFTEKEGLSIDYVQCIMEDNNGNLWFGTDGGGVSKYSNAFTQFTDKNGLVNKFVSSIHQDQNCNLWIGTFSGGVTKFDGQKFIHFTEKDGLTHNGVLSILEDKSGNMWFGTVRGVSKFDGKSFYNYTEKEGLQSNWVWSILEDTKGNIWFGTGGGGVTKFDGNAFTHFTEKQGLTGTDVKSMFEDQNGNLWFGTEGGGLNRFNGTNFTRFNHSKGLGIDFIREMVEDQYGNLWVGTQGSGLIKLTFSSNSDSVTFTRFTEFEGLSNNNVMAMSKSKKGDLWIGTAFGLSLLEAEKITLLNKGSSVDNNLFKTYTYEDGFSGIGLNHGKNIIVAADGTIWLGADDRLVAFYPPKQVMDKTKPNIQLTDLALFNENIAWQKLKEFQYSPVTNSDTFLAARTGVVEQGFSVKDTSFLLGNGVRVHNFWFNGLSKWYGVPENLSLPYDNNHLTFRFVGINTQAPQKIRYQYQLEGSDPLWSAITDRGEASYGNLTHGHYTFKVKAMNGEGIWSNELQYPFEIRPPWWLTWWANTLYAVIGLGLLYGLRKYTVNRERIKHELKIQKLETEKMHEVDQLKSRFFANISHEFRTPLTLILGPLGSFVSQSLEDSPDKPVFQMMQRNARRLLHLINQLLDLSKIETGSMKLETKPAELISFMQSIVLSFTSLADRKQIKYHFKYPPGHPVAYFDADKLEKIITNLLSNAFKVTPPGGKITVIIGLKPYENGSIPTAMNKIVAAPGTNILELKVEDSGPGISKDQIDKIFDRFYQIDPSHTWEREGTGIGLSLVKELVELHRGKILVESQEGQGSCFTIRLPMTIADYEEMALSELDMDNGEKELGFPDPAMEGMGNSSEPIKDTDPENPLVLVIEDNADVRFFIRENLLPFYQVMEASDGEEGYKLAIETIPDLILSDVMMPKMDGVTLCRKLKTNEKTTHVPIILLTAKASGGDKMEGLETGADDYLIKPFETAELIVRMNNLIDGRRKLREHFSREIILKPTGIAITSMDEVFLNQAMKNIEEHMADTAFGIDVLCRELGMSRTQLFRKFKALTDYPPGDFIRLMRLKRAAELLSHGAGSIAEVAFMVGFQDPSYFTKSFHKQYGQTPKEFINNGPLKSNEK